MLPIGKRTHKNAKKKFSKSPFSRVHIVMRWRASPNETKISLRLSQQYPPTTLRVSLFFTHEVFGRGKAQSERKKNFLRWTFSC